MSLLLVLYYINSPTVLKKKVLFSGDIKDKIPIYLSTKISFIYVTKYSKWIYLKKNTKIKCYFGVFLPKHKVRKCNTLIFFWEKDKKEAFFHIFYLLSILSISNEIYIVGENRTGVKSSESILKEWITLKKIHNSKKCTLFHGVVKRLPTFLLRPFIKSHCFKSMVFNFLPGVFGYKGLDKGTLLLSSTFKEKIHGSILEIGCGSGVLSIFILNKNKSKATKVTLVDICASSLFSSKINLIKNNLQAKVIASNVYSDVKKKYDLIISNPPIHNGLKLDISIVSNIIKNSKKYLKKRGELRIVINSFISCKHFFINNFSSFKIIARNKSYVVYRAVL